ncbi:MAG: transporter substrate-binding protein, partial [Pirellulaceae bacterium]|nr:transporter substrate-binding protein [Pirellulaceae bacterium]
MNSDSDEKQKTEAELTQETESSMLDNTVLGEGQKTVDPSGTESVKTPKPMPKMLGKYELKGLLGQGGMGMVMRGYDASIEREVAIKTLPSEIASSESALKRFEVEAKSTGKINHPNIVTIYEVGQEQDTHYLVMEVVAGGSVADYIAAHGAYPFGEATRIVSQACEGLIAAHKQGLIHRDIKPANLLLSEEGLVKITDFGLVKQIQKESLAMTKTGQVVGTPYFMSPEQCQSGVVDVRSDVYSLGATYFNLLTGKNPYNDAGSLVEVMFAHCNAPAPDPSEIRPDVPEACVQVIEKSMAKDPDDRYQSMEAMQKDLQAIGNALSGSGVRLPSMSMDAVKTVPAKTSSKKFAGSKLAMVGAMLGILMLGVGYFAIWGSGLGDGKTGEPSATGNAPQAAASVTGNADPIKVGVLHSLTGTMAQSETPVVDAVLLAIEQVNQEGGLLGRPVKAVVADGRSDWPTFAEQAERLILEDNVCAVFGCWTSASRKTVVPIFEEQDHLLVYPVQFEGIEESPNVIYTGAAPNQQILPAIRWAFEEQGKRRFFLIGSDYVFPRVAHQIMRDELESLGAEIVGDEFVLLGDTDVSPVIEKVRATKPDIIVNCVNGSSNSALFNSLRKGQEFAEVSTLSFSVGEQELRPMNIAMMTNDYAAWTYFQSIPSQENQDFLARFHEKYGPQRVVTDPMAAAYIGLKLWAKGVTEAQSTDPAKVRRAMRNQRLQAPEGVVRIDPATQYTYKTPRIGKVRQDGQFDIVW